MILLLLILLNFLPISFYDSSYIVLKYFYIFITQLIQKCILIAREFLEKLSNYFLISFRFFFFFYNNLEYFFPDFNILNYYSKPPKREEPTPYVLFSYFFNAICYPFNFGIFKISFRTGFFFLLDHYQSVKSFNRSDAGFFYHTDHFKSETGDFWKECILNTVSNEELDDVIARNETAKNNHLKFISKQNKESSFDSFLFTYWFSILRC
jgi:hypothetical protein